MTPCHQRTTHCSGFAQLLQRSRSSSLLADRRIHSRRLHNQPTPPSWRPRQLLNSHHHPRWTRRTRIRRTSERQFLQFSSWLRTSRDGQFRLRLEQHVNRSARRLSQATFATSTSETICCSSTTTATVNALDQPPTENSPTASGEPLTSSPSPSASQCSPILTAMVATRSS